MPIEDISAIEALVRPERLWSPEEVTARPSPILVEPGLYGWWFRDKLHQQLPAGQLLCAGIAQRRMTSHPDLPN